MKIVKALLLTLFVLLAACGSNDSSDVGMGPLTPIIKSDTGKIWSIRNDGDSVAMENKNDNGSVQYFYVNPNSGEEGQREISVELNFKQSQPESLAGLLYGFQSNPKSYFLFAAGNDENIGLYHVGENGFGEIMIFSVDNYDPEKVRLAIQERGNTIALFVNGTEKSTFSNDRTGRGAAGIVAVGKGTFQFSRFNIKVSGKVAERVRGNEGDDNGAISATAKSQKNVIFQELRDEKNGMVKSRHPFPEGWRFAAKNNNNLFIEGPNNIEVYAGFAGQYVFSDDPFAVKSARMAGGKVARPVPLKQFAEQQHSKHLSQQGFSLVTTYPMPQVNNYYELVSAGMPQGLSRRNFYSLGAEWKRQDGTRVFSILVQHVLHKDAYTVWGVQYADMYSSSAQFEQAKADYRYAVENSELNPQYQIFKNNELLDFLRRDGEKWQTLTAQSQAAHLGRMNAILARSESSSSIAKINSDILDISHAGYLKRSNMISAGQAKSVDMLGGTSIIANPNTGEHYRVEAGASHYWVNNQGKFFNTENALVDPRTDINISNQQWEKYELVR